ncbi:MAG: septum formation initiator family protein [Candidatus Omnitrophota bacterium]
MVSKKDMYLLGIIILGVVFLPGYIKLTQLHQRNRELRSKIELLKRQNTQYLDEIHKLQTDPLYVEKVAREKMGVVRDGEIIYKLVPEKKK